MNMFCVLALLILLSTIVDGKKRKQNAIKVADLEACMKRKNAVRDNAVNECRFYCLAELSRWIKNNKLNMGKVRRYYGKSPKVAADIQSKCGSIKTSEDCDWVTQVYECSKKIPGAKLPLMSTIYWKIE